MGVDLGVDGPASRGPARNRPGGLFYASLIFFTFQGRNRSVTSVTGVTLEPGPYFR